MARRRCEVIVPPFKYGYGKEHRCVGGGQYTLPGHKALCGTHANGILLKAIYRARAGAKQAAYDRAFAALVKNGG